MLALCPVGTPDFRRDATRTTRPVEWMMDSKVKRPYGTKNKAISPIYRFTDLPIYLPSTLATHCIASG